MAVVWFGLGALFTVLATAFASWTQQTYAFFLLYKGPEPERGRKEYQRYSFRVRLTLLVVLAAMLCSLTGFFYAGRGVRIF